jgi:SAM-dependent methyltransferase
VKSAARILSREEARSFYDRFGRKQDWQAFYEDRAVDALLRHGSFRSAKAVVEFGCGTGRLAARLLQQFLNPGASYVGFDISDTMLDLARARLAPWKERASVLRRDGSGPLPLASGGADRFLSTYVLDLLAEDEIAATLREARRVLTPGGLLCLASLTFGRIFPARVVSRAWSALSALNPRLVGGCRPLRLERFLGADWTVIHHEVVCAFAICSDVLVAR